MHRQTAFIQMSTQDFTALGMQDVAYLKTVSRDGRNIVAVHAADGSELAVADSYDIAMALVRQHGLEPLIAH